MFGKIGNYVKEVNKEVRKVNWPNREDLINNTVLTLVASFIIAMIIFAQDWVIGNVLDFIYQLLG